MSINEFSHLIKQIKDAAAIADDKTRRNLIFTLRDLAVDLEKPMESIERILYLPIEPSICRVGDNLRIYDILSEKGGSMTTNELAEKSNCDPVLMSRLLRFLAAARMITEEGTDVWAANHVTKTLIDPGLRGGLNHNFENVGPAYQALPAFFESTKYRNPDNAHITPFQMGHRTELPAFEWFAANPKNLGYFMAWMPAHRMGLGTWLDVFPVEKESQGVSSEQVLFADIGGGIGHSCLELKSKYPDIPGRVILQDRPETIVNAIPIKGVEALEHDFFKPQTIKGARFYYMRNILHDWPDDKCLEILSQIKGAMGPDSLLLIDEMVLPTKGNGLLAMQLDITMMAGLASMERTDTQWKALVEAAGFQIRQTYVYTDTLKDSVLVCVPRKS